MPEAVHPYFLAIYSQNPATKANKDLSEMIEALSTRADIDEIIEEIDRAIEDELDGWWDDASEVYYLDEDTSFDGTDSARDHAKEYMGAQAWLTVIDSVLADRSQKSEEAEKATSNYLDNVVGRLTSTDIVLMIDLLQSAYEEQSQDDDDFNPYAHEQSLLEAKRHELAKIFIEYFSLPRPGEKPVNIGSLDWIPDSLLDAFELSKTRDQIHEAHETALRQDKLHKGTSKNTDPRGRSK